MVYDEDGKEIDAIPSTGVDSNGLPTWTFNGKDDYSSNLVEYYDHGRIVYYGTNVEICTSGVLIPGTALLPKGLLGTAYAIVLIYLFMGIGIISEIFMGGIEKITSQTVMIDIKD